MKKKNYLGFIGAFIWIIIVEFLARGTSHGPEDLIITISFIILFMNLSGLFFLSFKSTQIFSYILSGVSAFILLFLLLTALLYL